jgi:hypothetical protein
MLGQIIELHNTTLTLDEVNDSLGHSALVETVLAMGCYFPEGFR